MQVKFEITTNATGFLSRLAQRVRNNPTIQNLFNNAFFNFIGNSYTRYDPNGPTYIEQGYNQNSIVYSVIQQMSTKTADVPFEVRRVNDKKASGQLRRIYQKQDYGTNPGAYLKYIRTRIKAFTDEGLEMPLQRPNKQQTWEEWLAQYKTFIRTTGNAYLYLFRPEGGPNGGVPLQVYWLPSHFMNIVVDKNANLMTDENPISHYLLIEGETYVEFPAEDVIHIRLPNPNYDYNGRHLYGQSPLAAVLDNIQSSNEAHKNNIKTMANGGAFGIIHGKGEGLDEEDALQLKQRLIEMDNGTERLSHYAGIGREIGFTKLSLTTEELRPFDYLEHDQKQICNALGWSDKLLNNDDGAKYDNVSQFRKQVITDNIIPDLELLSRAINDKFLPLFPGYEGTEIYFDPMQLPEMQQDTEKLVNWMGPLVDKGVISRQEMRVAIGYAPLPMTEMEVITVASSAIMPLSDALIMEAQPIELGPAKEVDDDDEDEKSKKKSIAALYAKFDPNQPRDWRGRWSDTGEGLGTLTDEEEKDIEQYTNTSYMDLNPILYELEKGATIQEIEDMGYLNVAYKLEQIDNIQNGLNKLPQDKGVFFRGDVFSIYTHKKRFDDWRKDMLSDFEISFAGFTSTSAEKSQAMKFIESTLSNDDTIDILYQIEGAAANVSNFSGYPEEQEHLFKLGTTFEFVSSSETLDKGFEEMRKALGNNPLVIQLRQKQK